MLMCEVGEAKRMLMGGLGKWGSEMMGQEKRANHGSSRRHCSEYPLPCVRKSCVSNMLRDFLRGIFIWRSRSLLAPFTF